MAASSLTVLSSTGLLSKSLHRPIVCSLLRPFAFYAYRYFKSNPHHLRPVASSAYSSFNINAMPPLLRPVVASSSSSAYRSSNTKTVADRLSDSSFPHINMYPHSLSSLTVPSAGHISKSLLLPIVFSLLRSIALSSLTVFSANLISKSFLRPIAPSSLTVSSPGLISKSYLYSIVLSVLRPSYRYFKANSHLISPVAPFNTSGMPQNADTHRNGLVSAVFDLFMKQVVFNKKVIRIIQSRYHWRETEDYMLIRMYMPGRFKEDVNINVYQNTLSIKGKRDGRESSCTHDLTGRHYKIDQIRARMKCSVLKVVLPKIKDGETTEERNDNNVIIVKVE